MRILRVKSILTGKRTLECEIRINNIEGADIAELFLNIFVFLIIRVALDGTLLRPFGSFSLKMRSIRTLIVLGRASYALGQDLTKRAVLVPHIFLYQPQ